MHRAEFGGENLHFAFGEGQGVKTLLDDRAHFVCVALCAAVKNGGKIFTHSFRDDDDQLEIGRLRLEPLKVHSARRALHTPEKEEHCGPEAVVCHAAVETMESLQVRDLGRKLVYV
ncbi:MAG: hypothetical protein QGG73_00395 [Candidatus Hydrogenedentes bacterium]|nr:hypothetical protein [Candidatus Hydrogenedentota bacterium]